MQIPPLKDVQESGAVADGWHEFTVTAAEEKDSKAGNPMIAVALAVEGGTVYDYIVLTEAALWKCKSFLGAIGCKQENLDEGFDLSMDRLIGGMGWLEAKSATETWEGKARVKVKVQRYAKEPPTQAAPMAEDIPF